VSQYRNHYDVSETVDVTNASAVRTEVTWILLSLYPGADTAIIKEAFDDIQALYKGEFPGYCACDTEFHNMQHILDVALAMARLMEGYERSRQGVEPLGQALFSLGVIAALFHDCGYVRRLDDAEHRNGAEMMQSRASRGGAFLKDYLPQLGLGDMGDTAAALLHFTGYEMSTAQIQMSSLRYRLLGSLLGSADIIAQMSDRCYLEKCRDRLYPELVAGGIAGMSRKGAEGRVLFRSGDDVVMATPGFYKRAMSRLKNELGNCYHFATRVFGGDDLYLKRIRCNVRFAQLLKKKNDTSLLKRVAPNGHHTSESERPTQ